MKEITAKLLAKAGDAIQSTEVLLAAGQIDFAVGRAYYAMFYVAEALLNEKDLKFGKHGNVHAAFGEYFAKTKALDPKYHRWLIDAFDKRQVGDYGVEVELDAETAQNMIQQAKEFLITAQEYLQKE